MKISPVEAELFRADRQKNRHNEANSRFSQVCVGAWKQDNSVVSFALSKEDLISKNF